MAGARGRSRADGVAGRAQRRDAAPGGVPAESGRPDGRCVREHSGDTEYLAELAMWSGRYGSVAGVPARNTPVPSHADFPARVFAGPALPQPPGAEARDDAGVVVVLATATDDNLALLRAGEATGVVLLTATALGLSSCPLTEPLEIDATRDTVRSTVLDGDGFPQMLMRIGWAPLNADPLPATPRRRCPRWYSGSTGRRSRL